VIGNRAAHLAPTTALTLAEASRPFCELTSALSAGSCRKFGQPEAGMAQ
jgi:hypothetical protein